MRTLHLLRHAKSDQNGLGDFGRPLAARGIKAAKLMAKHLGEDGLDVDNVYCSTARRTRQTYDLVEDVLSDAPVTFDDALYLADLNMLLGYVRDLPAQAHAALVIGHNPGFHDLAVALVGSAKLPTELENLRAKYPTGALCSIEFRGAWRDVGPGKGRLIACVRPRDLA